MLGHSNVDFTLAAYTHSTTHSQAQTAARMGDFNSSRPKKKAGQGRCPVQRMLFASDSCLGQIWVRFFRASAGGGIAWGRIRSPAGEPRRWKQSTGLFPRAGFRIRPPKKQRKTRVNQVIYSRFGGGGRIRTIEAKRSRFTVCPLWPLGNSPRYEILFCLDGAGRRTRTPDLLITNQLLYQLSYTGGSNRTRLL